jgi:hypothetical protein
MASQRRHTRTQTACKLQRKCRGQGRVPARIPAPRRRRRRAAAQQPPASAPASALWRRAPAWRRSCAARAPAPALRAASPQPAPPPPPPPPRAAGGTQTSSESLPRTSDAAQLARTRTRGCRQREACTRKAQHCGVQLAAPCCMCARRPRCALEATRAARRGGGGGADAGGATRATHCGRARSAGGAPAHTHGMAAAAGIAADGGAAVLTLQASSCNAARGGAPRKSEARRGRCWQARKGGTPPPPRLPLLRACLRSGARGSAPRLRAHPAAAARPPRRAARAAPPRRKMGGCISCLISETCASRVTLARGRAAAVPCAVFWLRGRAARCAGLPHA